MRGHTESFVRAGKQILLQRGQRQRKKPQWLDNTIDPHLTDRKWGLPAPHQVLPLHHSRCSSRHCDTGAGHASLTADQGAPAY